MARQLARTLCGSHQNLLTQRVLKRRQAPDFWTHRNRHLVFWILSRVSELAAMPIQYPVIIKVIRTA